MGSALLSDLTSYFAQFGFPPLPELSVTYGSGMSLHGAASRFVKDRDMRFLWTAPSITWDADETDQEAMIVMMDLDAGGRRSADGVEPGPIGPYVHAMYTHCSGGSLRSCKTMIPYVPPGVGRGTNRYVFLKMRQPEGKTIAAVDHTAHFARWDFRRFLEENYPAGTVCEDDAAWDNFSGKRCADYRGRWCRDGKFNLGAEWTGGSQFNFPERSCCACGKPPSLAAAPYANVGLAYNFMYVSGTVDEANGDPRIPLG